MNVAIVLNGEIKNCNYIKERLKEFDSIICADGGANHTYNMGIIPQYIIGDLDSVKNEVKKYYLKNKVDFVKFPEKKDETDTQLCIVQAKNIGAKKISLVGALGDRMDHTIANVNLLYYINEMGLEGRILGDTEDIYMTSNELVLKGEVGDIISVIPIYNDAIGVTLDGLEYSLDNFNMKFGTPIGISNVMLSKECKISLKKGSLLVIKNLS